MTEHEQEKLTTLLRLFERHRLEELILEEGGFRIHLRRGGPAAPAVVYAAPAPQPAGPPPAPGRRPRTVVVRAPLIGIFYRAPSPETPPLVSMGDIVREGQTVCIVEAMKVFNEIKSDWAGRVVAIPAESGKLVQAGEPLVVLEFLSER